MPDHRRKEGVPLEPSLELILYQLGELRGATEQGFDRLEHRFAEMERRVVSVEKWQAAREAVDRERARIEAERALARREGDREEEGSSTSRTVVLALSALATALAIIAALVERL